MRSFAVSRRLRIAGYSSLVASRPKPDRVLVDIADYVTKYKITSKEALDTARHCLIDTLGCGFEALSYPACTKLLGPIVPGTVVPHGAKVPGTPFQLDPVQAAFNIGAMIRYSAEKTSLRRVAKYAPKLLLLTTLLRLTRSGFGRLATSDE